MPPRTYDSIAPARFSRDWWLGGLRNTFWITAVTVLIWIYADLEFTDTIEQRAVLHLVVGQKDLLFANRSDPMAKNVQISFRVRGSRSGLTRLEEALEERGNLITLDVISAADAFRPGRYSLAVVEALNQTNLISDSGLTVLSASTAAVPFEIDRALEVSGVPVEFVGVGATWSDPAITPAVVDLRVAEKLWRELLAREASPVIRTEPVDLQARRLEEPIRVGLEPVVEGVPVLPETREVTVEVSAGSLTDQKTLPVTVRVQVPYIWAEDGTWQQYRLLRRQEASWVVRVLLGGPKTAIEEIRPEHLDAYIQLNDGHKNTPESWDTQQAQIRVGPEFPEVKILSPPPVVQFKLVEVEKAQPATAAAP